MKRIGERIYAACIFLGPIGEQHDAWIHTILYSMHGQEKQIQLDQLGKWIDFASHMVEADFDNKEAALKIIPMMDTFGFIAAISNTRALAWVLFTSTSPLTQDLHELYKMVIDGYHNGELEAVSDMQLDWYAHSLWSLYKDIAKFFKKQFTEDNLC